MQTGFFDQEDRLAKLKELGDPLPCLDTIVDWSAFRPVGRHYSSVSRIRSLDWNVNLEEVPQAGT